MLRRGGLRPRQTIIWAGSFVCLGARTRCRSGARTKAGADCILTAKTSSPALYSTAPQFSGASPMLDPKATSVLCIQAGRASASSWKPTGVSGASPNGAEIL